MKIEDNSQSFELPSQMKIIPSNKIRIFRYKSLNFEEFSGPGTGVTSGRPDPFGPHSGQTPVHTHTRTPLRLGGEISRGV